MKNILYYLFLTLTLASCYVKQEECKTTEIKYAFKDSIPICKNAYIYHDEFYDCNFLQIDGELTKSEIESCKFYINLDEVDDINSAAKLYTGKYKEQVEELRDYLYEYIESKLHISYESEFWQSLIDSGRLVNPEEYE